MDAKVAIMLGRGVEGAGVTKFAIEFNNNYKNSVVFATIDKKWPRRKLQPINSIDFECANDSQLNTIIDEINNNFDVLLIFSVPSTKHPQKCIDNFVELVKRVKCKKSVIQLDHNMMSISRNARLAEITNNCDVALSYTLNTDFCEWCRRRNVTTPIKEMNVGFNFDEHRKLFWRPIEEQKSNLIRWIGRLAGWKGPDLMIDYHNTSLRQLGFISILEGLEASIGYRFVVFKDKDDDSTRRPAINKFRPDSSIGENSEFVHGEETDGNVYLYPQFVWKDCMERMAKSAFGAELYHLKRPEMYGTHIEYCMCEIIACGAVPIFHADFGRNVHHRVTGNPVIEDSSGTIFLDENNFESVTERLVRLCDDVIFRNSYRERAFEYWKAHCNVINMYEDIVKKTLGV